MRALPLLILIPSSLSAALTKTQGDFEAYVGYTHLRFPELGGHNHEVGGGLSWGGRPLNLVVAFDADNFAIDRQLLRPGDATLKDFPPTGVELSWTL